MKTTMYGEGHFFSFSAKKIIGVVIFIFYFCQFCYSQQMYFTPSRWLDIHKKTIDSTAYIFEGTVIQQSKKGELLTCSVIQIKRIYKGSPQIKLGTIRVITEQSPNMHDAGPGLHRGHYIIFGRLSNSNAFPAIVADNTITVTLMANSIAFFGKVSHDKLISTDEPAAQWDNTQYKTWDELYSFLKENGLTVQEEVQPVDSAKQK